MGVEGGRSGAGSAGIGVGSALGLESFGAKITTPISVPSSEGPAGRSFLENTMPYTFNDFNIPRGGERFNIGVNSSIPESAEEVIAGVESILSKASPKPVGSEVPAIFQTGLADINLDPAIKSSPVYELNIFDKPAPKAFLVEELLPPPISNERTSVKAQSSLMVVAARILFLAPLEIIPTSPEISQAIVVSTEPKVDLQTGTSIKPESNLVYIQPQVEVSKIETKQVEEFEEVEEKREAKEPKDEAVELWVTHSVDKKTVKKRVDKIKNAGLKAKLEAEKEGKKDKIEGWRIFKHLISLRWKEFRGDELEKTNPEGTLPDGTWEANMEKIGQETFSSVEDVSERAPKIVALDNPIAKGEGEEVTDENMATTYKYDRSKIHAVHQVIKRAVKMQKQIKIVKAVEKTEGQITDHPKFAQSLKAA